MRNVQYLDLADDQFYEAPPMNYARVGHGSASAGDVISVFNRTLAAQPDKYIEILNVPYSREWELVQTQAHFIEGSGCGFDH